MAERRMFSKAVARSDSFIDMPLSTQALYFQLGLDADDDGFIVGVKAVQKLLGCGDDDLKLLIAKRFLLVFESGLLLVRHWKVNNYIRGDRHKATIYCDEYEQIYMDKNNTYQYKSDLKNSNILNQNSMLNVGVPNDNQMTTQTSTDKTNLGEINIDKNNNVSNYVDNFDGVDNFNVPVNIQDFYQNIEMERYEAFLLLNKYGISSESSKAKEIVNKYSLHDIKKGVQYSIDNRYTLPNGKPETESGWIIYCIEHVYKHNNK